MNFNYGVIVKCIIIYLMAIPLVYSQQGIGVIDSLFVRSQDSLKQKKVVINAYPYAFYSPETEAAIGAGGIMIYTTGEGENLRPSKLSFGGYYTSNKQYKITLNSATYFKNNDIVVEAPISYGYTLDKFWGIGNNTQESGTEGYFREDLNIQLAFQSPPLLFYADRSGVILEYHKMNIVDPLDNSIIINEEVLGSKGGDLFGVGFELIWDKRDHIFFPRSGYYQTIKFIVYPDPSDFIFTSFEVDVRHYGKIFKNKILASNFYLSGVSDGAPFYKLPAVGGQTRLRGYFQGRYRDRTFVMLQTEYRQYFSKRFGFVAFAGVGDVGQDITKLSLKQMKWSWGGGLRYLFNQKENVNLRMDIGIGLDGNTGIYFGIEESF